MTLKTIWKTLFEGATTMGFTVGERDDAQLQVQQGNVGIYRKWGRVGGAVGGNY